MCSASQEVVWPAGLRLSTVQTITQNVCELIVQHLWEENVKFPSTEEMMTKSINLMETFWQASYLFAAVDGCHISIKCPAGVTKRVLQL